MGTKYTRQTRINKIRGMVKTATIQDKEVLKTRLIAIFALDEGMAERSVKELVQTFINAGEFIEMEGGILHYDKRRINEDN